MRMLFVRRRPPPPPPPACEPVAPACAAPAPALGSSSLIHRAASRPTSTAPCYAGSFPTYDARHRSNAVYRRPAPSASSGRVCHGWLNTTIDQ
ncbi:hypothetical protein OSTOST_13304 [Ostertagia ostertagi]